MALKPIRSISVLSFLFVLVTTFFPARSVQASNFRFGGEGLPLLEEFASQVRNGQADELRGVYIPDILAARVVQQPTKNNEFVSPRENTLTQFGLATKFGATGLLAHNYLTGEGFFLLKENRKFYLIYGDGQTEAFVVTEILQYQALEPNRASSKFVDLANDDLLTAASLFSKIYNRSGQVIFQTCISRGQELSWGRLFVIAEPAAPKE